MQPPGENEKDGLQLAMERPDLDPHPMYNQARTFAMSVLRFVKYCLFLALFPSESIAPVGVQIVAGVLVKYVNFGKGWRHRLFVLQDGVLRYYKVGQRHNPSQQMSWMHWLDLSFKLAVQGCAIL